MTRKQVFQVALTAVACTIVLNSFQNSHSDIDKNQKEFAKDNPDFTFRFESKIRQLFVDKDLYGDFIFALVDTNGLAYSFSLNKDILNGKSNSLDADTPIYIASHTKSMTGTLMKILEEKGMLNLNDPLSNYLPELHFKDSIDTRSISLRSLLNHTHGTFSTRLTWKTSFLGYSGQNSELINDLNEDFLIDRSRRFRYSNVGPIIAGIVADEVTGKSWKEAMRKYIFEPLDMNRTSAYVSDFDPKGIRPSVTASKGGIVETGFYKEDVTMNASGGIISTVDDLSKWLRANIIKDPMLLQDSSWPDLHFSTVEQDREYFTYKRTGYSLGWDIASYQNESMLTRFGGLAGISVHISFMPDRHFGIIAFSSDNRASLLPHLMANYAYNLLNSARADSIFESEMKLYNESYEEQNAKIYFKRSDILERNPANEAISGVYRNSVWPDISIAPKGGNFTLQWGVLRGDIYKAGNSGFDSSLGVLNRHFEIRKDTLFTGSLVYIKSQ